MPKSAAGMTMASTILPAANPKPPAAKMTAARNDRDWARWRTIDTQKLDTRRNVSWICHPYTACSPAVRRWRMFTHRHLGRPSFCG
jgi:hypothetical protein